ncbi:MAG: zinc-binding dehydrogenase [Chloroflexota bacterium]
MQNRRIKERIGKNIAMMGVDQSWDNAVTISKFAADGHIRPAIDHLYELEQAPKALQRILDGKALGKIIVNVSGE